MPSERTTVRLGDVVALLTGFPFKSALYTDDVSAPRLLRGDNVVQGALRWDGAKHWPTAHVHEVQSYLLRAGDVVVAMDRPWIELGLKYAAVSTQDLPCLLVQRVSCLRACSSLNQRYLKYIIGGVAFTNHVLAVQTGTAIPHVSAEQIRSFTFDLPSLAEQDAAVEILGALDDKIELNRRMNETLEAMARALFKSWFVDFDPVRARADGRSPVGMDAATAALFPDDFEESKQLEVPRGWRLAPLPEVIEVNPPRPLPKGEMAPYLDMKNMPTAGHLGIDWEPRAHGSGVRFTNGDTLLARITPCLENGKTAFVDFMTPGQVGWGSTEYIVLHPKPPLPEFYGYLLARSEELRAHCIQSMTGTTGRQRVPASALDHFRVAVPPREVSLMFGRLTKPWIRLARANDQQSRTLRSLRDLLLPKLLSGELRIRDAEKAVGQVA